MHAISLVDQQDGFNGKLKRNGVCTEICIGVAKVDKKAVLCPCEASC